MKKYLKYAGACAALLALIGFILLLACPAVMNGNDVVVSGTTAIFGHKGTTPIFGLPTETKLAWSALLAFIFVIVALVILIAGVVLPILKVKALDKFAGLLNLCAVLLLLVAGVFTLITIVTIFTANGFEEVPGDCVLGAGWIIAGILFFLAGFVAIAPAAVDFLGKKK